MEYMTGAVNLVDYQWRRDNKSRGKQNTFILLSYYNFYYYILNTNSHREV